MIAEAQEDIIELDAQAAKYEAEAKEAEEKIKRPAGAADNSPAIRADRRIPPRDRPD
jgi:hypothetical protein